MLSKAGLVDSRIKVIEKTPVFKGYFRIDRYMIEHQLHGGGWSQSLVREVFERGHIGALLPFDPMREEVILIEQFRPGALAAGMDPWLIECVAGVIESGETAEQLVRRESMEEAGCQITALEPICTYLSSPGACSETVALFCGRVDTSDMGESNICGLDEEGEDILVKRFALHSAFDLLDSGQIVNAKTIIAVQWLRMHYKRLQNTWIETIQ